MGGPPVTVETLLAKATWHQERKALRAILLECGLTEAVKWGQLCYTFAGHNVAIFFGLKAYCGVGFFKGSLLRDPGGDLFRQGAHSQAMRMIRVTDPDGVRAIEPVLRGFVAQAIDLEKSGAKVEFREKHELVFPEELQRELDGDPAFKVAFGVLTPGRQRAYNLYFSAAKQSQTRAARIQKCKPRILDGKGMNDR